MLADHVQTSCFFRGSSGFKVRSWFEWVRSLMCQVWRCSSSLFGIDSTLIGECIQSTMYATIFCDFLWFIHSKCAKLLYSPIPTWIYGLMLGFCWSDHREVLAKLEFMPLARFIKSAKVSNAFITYATLTLASIAYANFRAPDEPRFLKPCFEVCSFMKNMYRS